MKRILKEVQRLGNIILFLDELHTIIGAGSAEGSIDAANIFKPALSRGRFRFWGPPPRRNTGSLSARTPPWSAASSRSTWTRPRRRWRLQILATPAPPL